MNHDLELLSRDRAIAPPFTPTPNPMNLEDLGELASSIENLVAQAELEIEAKRLEKQRDDYYQQALADLERKLNGLLETVQGALAKLPREEFADSPTRRQLEERESTILEQLELAPKLAEEKADLQLLLQEERLLESRNAERMREWRTGLKQDLLEMIREQEDFFSATDAAIALKGYVDELKAIDGLDEVVEALMDQINLHSEEGPVAKLRGTHEQTLTFIYNKAMENRSRVDRAPDVQPRVRHRPSEKRPNPYAYLEGKVVIFGGHDRLQTAVKNRLRDSKVDLQWYTAQDGVNLAQQGESHIASADLVVIVTGYASHSLTEKAIHSAKKLGINPEMVNTTGMTKLLEVIEMGLKTQLLRKRFHTA